MKGLRNSVIALIFALSTFSNIFAEEGMFLVNSIPKGLKGLKLSQEDIYKSGGGGLAGAVLNLGGGTGSFVSQNGLILTNHHVAFGAIQMNSTPENNYIEEGFYAKSYEEELPAPGYEAWITLCFEDITDSVLAVVTDEMSPEERTEAIRRRAAEIEKRSEDKERGIEGRVVSMLDGSYYYLFKYLRIKDIRLVYAPPSSIGNYGGDIDNWMWPRHGGDFSFMRAYVGPDGLPAEYSKENVAYKPESYLHFSSKGVKNGDFVFIMGYPGGTMRYRTSYSVDWNQNLQYPLIINLFKSVVNLLEKESESDEEVAIKVASRIQGLNNSLKYYEGVLDGFKKSDLLRRKREGEEEFKRLIDKNPRLREEYGNVLNEIDKAYKEHRKDFEVDFYTQYLTLSQTLSFATTIQKWSEEKEKPDSEREPMYMDYQIPNIRKRMEVSAKNYHAPTDSKVLKLLLKVISDLPQEQYKPFIKETVMDKRGQELERAIDEFVDTLFAKTRLVNNEDRMKMFDMKSAELDSINDPFIVFAKKINDELERIKKKNDNFSGRITQLRPKYYKALAELKGEEMYPDANRTIRFTYGHVKGYIPKDGVFYRYITGLNGVVEKHTGKEPFNAPEKLIEMSNKKDYGKYIDNVIKDVPVNFLATTDITGGNSGSPVLNGHGELVGCAFDGNWESMTSDWQFSDALTRTISVDARYILYILDKFSNAKEILKELSIH